MTTTPPSETETAVSPDENAQTFFDFIFGPQVLPVQSYDDLQDEMDYLEGGGVYGLAGSCQACAADFAPFVVSSAPHPEESDYSRTWRATCLQCYSQVRIPTSVDDNNEWQLHEEQAEVVALEPVPQYREQPVDTQPQPGAAAQDVEQEDSEDE